MRYSGILAASLVLGIAFHLGAQNDTISFDLSSPYHTLVTHLRYLQPEEFHPEIAAKTINPDNSTGEKAVQVVVKIKQIFDAEGVYVELAALPNKPGYRDTSRISAGIHRYVITPKFPSIYLERVGSSWYYSKRTVDQIDELHRQVFPFGTHRLLNLLPKMGNRKFLGLSVWQHVSLIIIVFVGFLIYRICALFFKRIIIRILARQGYKKVADKFVLPVARPFSILVLILFLILFIPIIQLPVQTGKYILLTLKALLPFFATLVFYRLIDLLNLYFEKLAGKTETTLDDQLVPLIRKTLKTFVAIIGGLFILDNLDVPIIPLLTGLSIGGLAFALAAQDTIKNFFGSLMIFIDKPFQIGDWITAGNIDGTVEEVGFRSTRIRTFRNSLTTLPNGQLADMTVDNHGMRVYRRFYTRLTIAYDTPTDLIQVFVDGLKKIVEGHPNTRKDFYEIHLNDFGASALEIMFYIFFQAPTWGEELKYRHEVMLSIIRLAEDLKVRFAFPTRTLHMENFPGQPSLIPEYNLNPEQMRTTMEESLRPKN